MEKFMKTIQRFNVITCGVMTEAKVMVLNERTPWMEIRARKIQLITKLSPWIPVQNAIKSQLR